MRVSFRWLAVAGSAAASAVGLMGTPVTARSAEPVRVVATIAPLGELARGVGGDTVTVTNLVPAGASPHVWEPSPAQVAALARADLLIVNGAGLEPWAPDLIEAASNDRLVVVDTSLGIELIDPVEHDHGGAEPGEAHRHDGERHGDPHVWLDPTQARRQAERIAAALIDTRPSDADRITRISARYLAELDALDAEIAREVAGWTSHALVTFHPAWGYFARRYGLEQIAVLVRSPGREPTPRELAEIVRTMRRAEARVVFSERQFSPKLATTVASETGARVLELDPLGARPVAGRPGEGYLDLMRRNVSVLGEGLR